MIKGFSFWCQKIVPLVYDNSVSYWETLCKVSEKLNEVINQYNNFQSETKDYIDNRLAVIINEWTSILNQALDSQNKYVESRLKNNKDWLANEIALMEMKLNNRLSENVEWVTDRLALNEKAMTALQNSVESAIGDLKAYIDSQVATLNEAIQTGDASQRAYTNAMITELRSEIPAITSVIVTDPVTGCQMSIQDSLENMYRVLRYGGLTAGEYDSLSITAGEYDDKHLTSWEYDMYGVRYLWPYMPFNRAFHPVTGSRDRVQFVEYYLANFARTNGLTATAYDNLGLTAEAYDNLERTAYDYDWSGV